MLIRLTLTSILAATGATADTIAPDYTIADFSTAAINPYFPLDEGRSWVLAGGGERSEIRNLGLGPVILGVQNYTQLDRAFEDGVLVEETYDYFAADALGTVWYFGEDVTNYVYDDDGNLIETNDESAWRAGVDGALPGWQMPHDPTIGLAYFQEIAEANDAIDVAEILALGETVAIPGVGRFEDVLITYETNPLEPDSREFKYYAPGLGLIRVDEGLDDNRRNPDLIVTLQPTIVPLPAGFPLLAGAFVALFALFRRGRDPATV